MQCHVWGSCCSRSSGRCSLRTSVAGRTARSVGRSCAPALVRSASSSLAYLPLVVHELTTGGLPRRGPPCDYLAAAVRRAAVALPMRFGIVGLRVVSWPLVGSDHRRVRRRGPRDGWRRSAIVLWRWRSASPASASGAAVARARPAWTALALTVAAPSLAVGRRAACRMTTTTRSRIRWCSCCSGSAWRRSSAPSERAGAGVAAGPRSSLVAHPRLEPRPPAAGGPARTAASRRPQAAASRSSQPAVVPASPGRSRRAAVAAGIQVDRGVRPIRWSAAAGR